MRFCLPFLVTMLAIAGCAQSNDVQTAQRSPDIAAKTGTTHTHEAWWCDEHGMPEEVCAQCSAKLAADFKRKGDWCAEHERPDSQCFVCHPELEAKFAAHYEAKYGKQPPKPESEPTDNGHKHEHNKPHS